MSDLYGVEVMKTLNRGRIAAINGEFGVGDLDDITDNDIEDERGDQTNG